MRPQEQLPMIEEVLDEQMGRVTGLQPAVWGMLASVCAPFLQNKQRRREGNANASGETWEAEEAQDEFSAGGFIATQSFRWKWCARRALTPPRLSRTIAKILLKKFCRKSDQAFNLDSARPADAGGQKMAAIERANELVQFRFLLFLQTREC